MAQLLQESSLEQQALSTEVPAPHPALIRGPFSLRYVNQAE